MWSTQKSAKVIYRLNLLLEFEKQLEKHKSFSVFQCNIFSFAVNYSLKNTRNPLLQCNAGLKNPDTSVILAKYLRLTVLPGVNCNLFQMYA